MLVFNKWVSRADWSTWNKLQFNILPRQNETALLLPGGWYGFKELVVTDKIKESEEVTSFYLQHKDKSEEMPDSFKPGQYLSFRLARGTFVGIDHDVVRNYSISCGPGQGQFRISVKRLLGRLTTHPKGLVSNYFHDNVKIGSVVEVMSMTQNIGCFWNICPLLRFGYFF